MRGPKPDTSIVGSKFGRLTVVGLTPYVHKDGRRWDCECACECGGRTVASKANLRKGHSQSCGCLQREKTGALRRSHGLSSLPLHQNWRTMIARCHNPKHPQYANYGGRGISVCARWRESFENFSADMGQKPSPDHSLDRKDNDGNYEPGNVRWTTRTEQMLNTRRSIAFRARRAAKQRTHAA